MAKKKKETEWERWKFIKWPSTVFSVIFYFISWQFLSFFLFLHFVVVAFLTPRCEKEVSEWERRVRRRMESLGRDKESQLHENENGVVWNDILPIFHSLFMTRCLVASFLYVINCHLHICDEKAKRESESNREKKSICRFLHTESSVCEVCLCKKHIHGAICHGEVERCREKREIVKIDKRGKEISFMWHASVTEIIDLQSYILILCACVKINNFFFLSHFTSLADFYFSGLDDKIK